MTRMPSVADSTVPAVVGSTKRLRTSICMIRPATASDMPASSKATRGQRQLPRAQADAGGAQHHQQHQHGGQAAPTAHLSPPIHRRPLLATPMPLTFLAPAPRRSRPRSAAWKSVRRCPADTS
ncbi:hypothetical protein G6F22_019563 [Rhizopus arrhizus]|nr:hypothetical protein G6F22_019563 [Rhizopus arrhizus]KAG1176927.1 hypothetical protein G6F35_016432 [Rhizopus arrhizus]